ncbi:MAG TPA: type IV toxin-antitoxin system AbiEi family antitoxin domain-containing protein [Pseudolysinimonas sp.]|jgi:very-short-patch-repair endonuclease|nr:type IV toxin-antitoxin system AbiEi family antitoxin domain-containing protein [Pseudolysinimonas sp.]
MLGHYTRSRGGILPRSTYVRAGVTQAALARAVRCGELVRVRRGWYAVPDAAPDAVEAVAGGGRLTCEAALRRHGVWCLRNEGTHVALDPGARHASGIRFHSARLRAPRGPDPAFDSVLEALERLAHCAPRTAFVVSADSALQQGLVTRGQLEAVFGGSVRGDRLLGAIDGTCESGVESIVRLALRRRRVRMRGQVKIPGVGRVDLVVGDRLVVECDGFEWHGNRRAFEEDRRRDLALSARGYHPVRLTYSRVLNAWSDVERELLMLVRRGEHRWASRHVALGHARRVHDLD